METNLKREKIMYLLPRWIALIVGLAIVQFGYSQQRQITGTIVDQTNNPLIGVTISVVGSTIGTTSNIDGKYSIKVADNKGTLKFSFIGYETQEIAVGDLSMINVTLQEEIQQLDEIMVVGYGVQKKSDLTGSIASVSGEQLSKLAVSGIDQALQGKAAGVNVIQNTGMPGGKISIQIRGVSSINGADPLVIVDGMPGSLSTLNTSDIESIEILKDASSAAIYGASGGNGVVLVTTKKGKSGKMVTTFNHYRGVQNAWKKIDVLNSQQYAQVMDYISMIKNPNRFKPYTTQPDTLPNYDWQDIMFRQAIMENYDLSFSGGNESNTFNVSGNYLRQDGTLRNSDYEKYNFHVSSDHKINKYLKVGQITNFNFQKYNGYEEWEIQSEYGPIPGIITMYPFVAPYDKDGNWSVSPNGGGNPKVGEDVVNKQRKNYIGDINVYLDFTPFKGFTYTSRAKSNLTFNVNDQFNKVYNYNPTTLNEHSSVTKSINQYYDYSWQNFANYTTTLNNDHNINLMAGMEANYNKLADISGTRYDLMNEAEDNRYLDASTDIVSASQIVKGGGNHNSGYSYFARLNYDYRSKYLFTANVRQDYSSKFGSKNKKGTFPSFSLGWKFSEEEFVKNIDVLSFGKVRFGYGQTGANALEGYRYIPLVNQNLSYLNYTFDGSSPSQGAASSQIANPNMKWETMTMENVGIDLSFFRNIVNLSVDIYEKTSSDMLYYKSLLSSTGIYQDPSYIYQQGGDARPLMNLGNVRNRGIDISLGFKKLDGELKTSVDFNLSVVRNKVMDIAGDTLLRGNVGTNLSNVCITTAGLPISQFWGFKTEGIYTDADAGYHMVNGKSTVFIKTQPFYMTSAGDTVFSNPKAKPGDLRFKDLNNDGKIDDKDKTVIGNPMPKFTFGFSCNMEYKNFDLNMNWMCSYGNQIFNGGKLALMNQEEGSNRSTDVLKQYRSPVYNRDGVLLDAGNINTTYPRLDPLNEGQNLTRVSDFFVEDASFIRLKNIQLGYTIPLVITQKIGVEQFRIYVGAKNLFTFTKYSGFDPELGSSNLLAQGVDKSSSYPQARMFLCGINLKF